MVAVTDENIVGLFAALLAERRVLLTASKLSTVRRGQLGRGGAEAWLRPWGRDDGADSYSDPTGQHPRAKPWLCPFQGQG